VQAGFRVWQFLPLGPVGSDGSPYWVQSDFAGNTALLPKRSARARSTRARPTRPLEEFRAANEFWLGDFALHRALTAAIDPDWRVWPTELRERETTALQRARRRLAPEIERAEIDQWRFARAWCQLREYAHERGVALLGDLPIYVAPDAVETWVHRRQFQLTASGQPRCVAGVPPDYFAAQGQLWGNPLYDWDVARADGFAHFRRRVAAALARADLLRLDHFRGLVAHWAIPADAVDARAGAWRPTPGRELLTALAREIPLAALVAEDLGDIDASVRQLRDDFALPGMHVLQFAFDGDPRNAHLPSEHRENALVYVGTHDNDTALGWVLSLDSETLRRVSATFGVRPGLVPAALTNAALDSRSRLAMLSVADLLQLGSEARFNTPGVARGNWRWRLPTRALTAALAERTRAALMLHRRLL
jgi:4-alpha-glucanotransferase